MAVQTTEEFKNGGATSYAITIEYLKASDIKVRIDGALQTYTTGTPGSGEYSVSGTTVTLGAAAPSGSGNVHIYRETDVNTAAAVFAAGSSIRAADLNAIHDMGRFASVEHRNTIITDDIKDSAVTSSKIKDGTIVNADINASAAIDGSKLQASSGSVAGSMSSANFTKLAGIETGATADQTASEIRTLVESATDSNVFTDADHTKLDGIETAATADQTASEIRTLVESASDSNVFTDADHTKLNGIETSATADQTGAEIKSLYEGESNTNAFTDAEKTKLAGISASAGATTFTGLGDTPANFTSAAGKTVKVNSSADALEFVDQISDVVGDTTPQLGGDLDVQAREINTSTSNGNIKLNPNGSGAVEVKGDGSSNDGKLQLNCSQNSHGVKLQSPAHSAGQSYTMILPDNQIAADKFLKVKSITGSGATAVGQLEYADGGGGATGGGGEKIFHESENQMDSDYTISANHNAIVPTPLTINATLTVGATSTVTFV